MDMDIWSYLWIRWSPVYFSSSLPKCSVHMWPMASVRWFVPLVYGLHWDSWVRLESKPLTSVRIWKMASPWPGRLAILSMASQVYDFLAIVILDYAPLVEDYKIYGMACWFVLKGVVRLGIAIYKICRDNQDRNVYELFFWKLKINPLIDWFWYRILASLV